MRRRLPSCLWGGILFVGGISRAWAAPAPIVRFEVDPRVELLGVVHLLADPEEARLRFADDPPAYVREAERFFAGMSGHPVVARFRRMLVRGLPAVVQGRVVLLLTPPPDLAPIAPLKDQAAMAGGKEEEETFLRELRDFSTRSRFMEFFASEGKAHRRFIEQAGREYVQGQSLGAVSAYLGVRFEDRYRFLLTPLLPGTFGISVRLKAGARFDRFIIRRAASGGGRPRFDFDAFGNSAAHDLAHTPLDPIMKRFEGEISALAGGPPAGCNDSAVPTWQGCITEHLVYAVTFRAMALEGKEERFKEELKAYAGAGYPYLEPLCERLTAYEADRALYPTLEDFFPRLLEVFPQARREEKPSAATVGSSSGTMIAVENPAGTDEAANGLAKIYNRRGVEALLQGDYPSALSHFNAAIEADPKDVEAHLNRAVTYDKSGDKEKALDSYTKALWFGVSGSRRADGGLLADVLSSRATLLEALGKEEQAREDIQRALAVAPAGWSRRGEAERRLRALGGPLPAVSPPAVR